MLPTRVNEELKALVTKELENFEYKVTPLQPTTTTSTTTAETQTQTEAQTNTEAEIEAETKVEVKTDEAEKENNSEANPDSKSNSNEISPKQNDEVKSESESQTESETKPIPDVGITTKVQDLTKKVKDLLLGYNIPRYKYIVQLNLFQNSDSGSRMDCSMVWDTTTDQMIKETIKTDKLTCVVVVFSVYYH